MDVQPIRVIVTETDAEGTARIASDGPATPAFHREPRPVALTDLWHLPSVPASIGLNGRPSPDDPFKLSPNRGGLTMRIVQFDPELADTPTRIDGPDVFAGMGAAGEHVANARHPYMHRTETVDFGIVLQGSITMLLDHEDVEMSAGDVVVQRGTNHAWANRSSLPCLVAFVLIDGKRDETID